MNYRDMAERLFWTLLAAFLGSLAVSDFIGISAVQAGCAAAASAGVNFLLIVARARLAVLPNPGDGLPGLETEDEGQSVVGVLLVILVVLIVLRLFGAI